MPQDAPVNFMGSANAQSLIDTERKRLCRKASPETRTLAEDMKAALYENYEIELSECLVPNCVYRCGCPELEPCPFWGKFCEEFYMKYYDYSNLGNIRARYEVYNDMFWRER